VNQSAAKIVDAHNCKERGKQRRFVMITVKTCTLNIAHMQQIRAEIRFNTLNALS